MLITEILADMTEEEAKAEGFNSLEEFRKECPKITNHPLDLEETVTAYGFRNTEKQQDRVQNHEKQKHSNTCQRQKSEHCAKCYGFNNYKPNFTTMESFQ